MSLWLSNWSRKRFFGLHFVVDCLNVLEDILVVKGKELKSFRRVEPEVVVLVKLSCY